MAATTQQQLDAINNAIARGVLSYTNPVDGSQVTYPSLSELIKAKAALESLLSTENSGATYQGIAFGRAGGYC